MQVTALSVICGEVSDSIDTFNLNFEPRKCFFLCFKKTADLNSQLRRRRGGEWGGRKEGEERERREEEEEEVGGKRGRREVGKKKEEGGGEGEQREGGRRGRRKRRYGRDGGVISIYRNYLKRYLCLPCV